MAYRRGLDPERMEKLVLSGAKKFVSYQEGADLMSLGLHTFEQLAKDANAIYKIKRRTLVNIQIVYEYMEAFREEN